MKTPIMQENCIDLSENQENPLGTWENQENSKTVVT